jgi:hypothetical protein
LNQKETDQPTIQTDYLTAEKKACVLARFENLRSSATAETNDDLDASIIPCLERINALRPFATLQSCQGHADGQRNGKGILWIWFTRDVRDALFDSLSLLRVLEHVDAVAITMKPKDGAVRPVLEIIFEGLPSGLSTFEEATGSIVRVLREVAESDE